MLHPLVTASLLANVPARGGSSPRVAFGALFATLLIVTGAPKAVAATPTSTAVPGLEIRFCPAARVHPWPAADALQKNIEYQFYDSGHMVYAKESSLKQLHDSVADFIRRTSAHAK